MFELTINNEVYQFNFGMGFMRDINKTVTTTLDGAPNIKKNVGLQYAIAGVLDGDVEALIEILDYANKGQNPRLTRGVLDAHIDNPDTDIDFLFSEVLDFLGKANATKQVTQKLLEAVERQKQQN